MFPLESSIFTMKHPSEKLTETLIKTKSVVMIFPSRSPIFSMMEKDFGGT